ncbi:phage portal protein [Paracoccus sp. (in: a-proteobacteria)]|uniref:phage portal protein n=1 Tax=Paracoccus sp. TaxID=267 RepID=UPI0032205933
MTVDQLARVAGWIGWGTSSGGNVTEATAVDVTAVFCAARVIAEGIAQMPCRVVSETFDGSGLPRLRVERDHWAHRLLAVRPNGWQTAFEFREGMIFNAVLGKGAIAIKNVVRGQVRELLPVPAGAWSVEQLADYSLRIRVDYADKTHGFFTLDQVFYLRGPSLDGFQGLPAVRQAREAIGLSRALERQQGKLAGNGGKPSGVLSFANRLAPETAEKLRETWQHRFGPNGDGGIAILDGDAKFQSMTMTSVDAQHLETRRLQIEEIARAFRVQPIMLMQADKAATFASAEQMFRNHVIHTLGPWVERWEQAANRDILGNVSGLRVDLDERNLLRGDFKDQAEYYTKALGAGGQAAWMTVNEIRAEVGLNPVSDAWANTVSRGAMSQGNSDGNEIPQP